MIPQIKLKKYYPKLVIRILLYLRKGYYENKIVNTRDLIKKLDKSNSIISQNVKILINNELISRIFVGNSRTNGPRVQFSITKKGLLVANRILFEGLTATEQKTINALNIKFY